MTTPKQPSIHCMIHTMQAIKEFLGQVDIPMTQLLTFAHVAEKGEIKLQDLVSLTGVGLSSVSRNVAKLGAGASPTERGYDLVQAKENPYYRKEKLVTLTERGKALVNAVNKAAARYLKAA